MARSAQVKRSTNETMIRVDLDVDKPGQGFIDTGIGFFDHVLNALQKHAGWDLTVKAEGDLYVDGHHTVEDVGITLGSALSKAVGDASGIARFGHALCPLDEALARSVVDVSGRPFFKFNCELPLVRVGEFEGELFSEFWQAFAMNAKITLHLTLLYGENQHHAMEAMTKAAARALRMALKKDDSQTDIPSTKGVLT